MKGLGNSADKLVETFRTFLFEIPLILAAIGANDNRLELEDEPDYERESSNMILSNTSASELFLEPVRIKLNASRRNE